MAITAKLQQPGGQETVPQVRRGSLLSGPLAYSKSQALAKQLVKQTF